MNTKDMDNITLFSVFTFTVFICLFICGFKFKIWVEITEESDVLVFFIVTKNQ